MEFVKVLGMSLLSAGFLSASLKNIITKRDIYLGSLQFVTFIECLTIIITMIVKELTSYFN